MFKILFPFLGTLHFLLLKNTGYMSCKVFMDLLWQLSIVWGATVTFWWIGYLCVELEVLKSQVIIHTINNSHSTPSLHGECFQLFYLVLLVWIPQLEIECLCFCDSYFTHFLWIPCCEIPAMNPFSCPTCSHWHVTVPICPTTLVHTCKSLSFWLKHNSLCYFCVLGWTDVPL